MQHTHEVLAFGERRREVGLSPEVKRHCILFCSFIDKKRLEALLV